MIDLGIAEESVENPGAHRVGKAEFTSVNDGDHGNPHS